ncbi:MAG: flagellar assembly peptidoglycan hydrolase FlgJ [Pseudomonadales bacterium]|nr:flagellar assembly peptidoglycan hydrolase FlgJ [Pseudomonadales bacterium]
MQSIFAQTSPANLSDARSMSFSDINALKNLDKNSEKGVRAVAEQFESLFLDMVLKSMREANKVMFKDTIFSSNETEMHQEMLDHQWAIHLSENRGVGLADMIERQLKRGADDAAPPSGEQVSAFNLPDRSRHFEPHVSAGIRLPVSSRVESTDPLTTDLIDEAPAGTVFEALQDQVKNVGVQVSGFRDAVFKGAEDFVTNLLPTIKQVVSETPFNALALIAQGALETGWGSKVIQRPEGGSSHNLFGVKAGANWQGDSVPIHTIEYESGKRVSKKDSFRAYENWESAIRDYIDFVGKSSRYATAVSNASDPERYAENLQKAGYATDPKYADKIKQIMQNELFRTLETSKTSESYRLPVSPEGR